MAECDCIVVDGQHKVTPTAEEYSLIEWQNPRRGDPRHRQTVLVVTIDWDEVPGWGYHGDRHDEWLQRLLEDMVPHYNPTVTRVDSEWDDTLSYKNQNTSVRDGRDYRAANRRGNR